jgi:hypothetical protein
MHYDHSAWWEIIGDWVPPNSFLESPSFAPSDALSIALITSEISRPSQAVIAGMGILVSL